MGVRSDGTSNAKKGEVRRAWRRETTPKTCSSIGAGRLFQADIRVLGTSESSSRPIHFYSTISLLALAVEIALIDVDEEGQVFRYALLCCAEKMAGAGLEAPTRHPVKLTDQPAYASEAV